MDISLNYTEKGTGFPLVLLHGNGESLQYFSAQIAYFSRSRRVIAVDTRGHGGSPRGTAPFTIEQFAEDLKEFLDERGIRRADILGFSDGGNIALTFAIRCGSYVERLILNGANLAPWGVKARVQIPDIIRYADACIKAGRGDEKALKVKELLGLMIVQPHIRRRELSAMKAPTLVIVGDRDMIRDSHSRKIAAALPDGAFCRLKGSHFVAAEDPEAFNREVELFLTADKGQGGQA